MAAFTHLDTIWRHQLSALGELTRLSVDSGGGSAPELVLRDPWQGITASASLDSSGLRAGDFQLDYASPGAGLTFVNLPGGGEALDSGTLVEMQQDGSAISRSETLYSGRSGLSVDAVEVVYSGAAGSAFFFVTDPGDASISSFSVAAGGGLSRTAVWHDTGESHGSAISAMTAFSVGAQEFLAVASMLEDGVSVFGIGHGGSLSLLSSLGASEMLPISRPEQIAALEVDGRHYLALLSSATQSVTSLRVDAAGQLSFADQIIDGRITRFGEAEAMAWHRHGDAMIGAVAGSDGGISLIQLLPGGRLVHLATMVDGVDTALGRVTDLEFADVAGRLELFALGAGADAGLTRIAVDLGAAGVTRTGDDPNRTGGSGRDVLVGADGGDQLDGRQGDDILMDGSGTDRLTGGDGRDIFIIGPDDSLDRITDFDPLQDRLDLSRYPMLYSARDIGMTSTATGARLVIQGDTLILESRNGAPIDLALLTDARLFNADHVRMTGDAADLEVTESSGGAGADTLSGTAGPDILWGQAGDDMFWHSTGADTFEGGAGIDLVSYLHADTDVRLDLENQSQNAGAAANDVLNWIESIEGSIYADFIAADGRGNTLLGNRGNDTLLGRAGDDTLFGGEGADRLDGGAGRDLVSYIDAPGPVSVDLLAPGNNLGEARFDTLISIEDLRGSAFDDDLRGDGADNMLIGGLGADFMMGRDGSDIMVGGPGNDTLSGGEGNDILNGGRGNDRLVGNGGNDRLVGDDGNDSLVSISGNNSLIGGAGNDTLFDASGDSVLYAGTGDDRLIGSGGNDRLYGAAGNDRLSGGNGNDRLGGDEGNDYMVGGGGWDIFVFRRGGEADTIGDFTPGEDRLFLSLDLTGNVDDASAVLGAFGSIAGGNAVLDFGAGDTLTLVGIDSLGLLEESLVFVL